MSIDWANIRMARRIDELNDYIEDLEGNLFRANRSILRGNCVISGMNACVDFLQKSVISSGDPHGLLRTGTEVHDKGRKKGEFKTVLDLIFERGYLNEYDEIAQDNSNKKYLKHISETIWGE